MTQRSLLQAQILEKLGAPLVSAVGVVSLRVQGEEEQGIKQNAVRTAELLGKAVQVSTAIAGNMGLKGADDDSEAVRVALTALSGRIVADYYRQSGKVPSDNDIAKLLKALEAVLTFSDNFVASSGSVGRVEQVKAGVVFMDENQQIIQFVNILAPVINAIAGFSFGRPENVLVQEVSDRLIQQAESMRIAIFGSGEATQETFTAELSFLKALVEIYVQSHNEAVEKLKSMGGQGNAVQQPIDIVWESFGTKLAMLEFLTKHIVPSDDNSGDVKTQPLERTEPVTAPLVEQKKAEEESVIPSQGDTNPMTFFKAKEDKGDDEGGEAGNV